MQDKNIQNLLARVNEIRKDLALRFIEREPLIRAQILAYNVRGNLSVIGPAGTVKSMLTKEIARMYGYDVMSEEAFEYFYKALNAYTTPSELFGPPALDEEGAMYQDTYRMLPEARVGFLDEGFKANSACLNGLLEILNERTFDGVPVPMESITIASNELPEGIEGGLAGAGSQNLQAMWDRMIVRTEVRPVSRKNMRHLMLRGGEVAPATVEPLTTKERLTLQALVAHVNIPVEVLETATEITLDLRDVIDGISDRRAMKIPKILQGHALACGRMEVTLGDLEILPDALANLPEDRGIINKTVDKFVPADVALVRSTLAKGEKLTDQARKAFREGNLTREDVKRIQDGKALDERPLAEDGTVIENDRQIPYVSIRSLGETLTAVKEGKSAVDLSDPVRVDEAIVRMRECYSEIGAMGRRLSR